MKKSQPDVEELNQRMPQLEIVEEFMQGKKEDETSDVQYFYGDSGILKCTATIHKQPLEMAKTGEGELK